MRCSICRKWKKEWPWLDKLKKNECSSGAVEPDHDTRAGHSSDSLQTVFTAESVQGGSTDVVPSTLEVRQQQQQQQLQPSAVSINPNTVGSNAAETSIIPQSNPIVSPIDTPSGSSLDQTLNTQELVWTTPQGGLRANPLKVLQLNLPHSSPGFQTSTFVEGNPLRPIFQQGLVPTQSTNVLAQTSNDPSCSGNQAMWLQSGRFFVQQPSQQSFQNPAGSAGNAGNALKATTAGTGASPKPIRTVPVSPVGDSRTVNISDSDVESPHRSRSRKRRRSKDRHRSSSSSSSDRDRDRRSRKRRSATVSQDLSQVISLLTQVVQNSALPSAVSRRQEVAFSPAPSVSSRDSPGLDLAPDQGLSQRIDSPGDSSPDRTTHEAPFSEGNSSDSEEEPLYGTDISKEAFDRAVEVLRRQLGFQEEDQPAPSAPPKKSKLSLNRPSMTPRATMPVDIECSDRLKSFSTARKWSAFPKKQSSSFRVDEKDWKDLFLSPSLPDSATDFLREAGLVDLTGKYKAPLAKKLDSSLAGSDAAARTGLKYSSSLLLIAEVLSRASRQSGSHEVSKSDWKALVNILGPLSRRIFDQFARIVVRSLTDRRSLVLDSLDWIPKDGKRRFQKLPMLGSDIFGGEFGNQIQAEVKRRKDLNKADINTSGPSSSSVASSRFAPKRSPIRTQRFRKPAPPSRRDYQTRQNRPSAPATRGRSGPSFRGTRRGRQPPRP